VSGNLKLVTIPLLWESLCCSQEIFSHTSVTGNRHVLAREKRLETRLDIMQDAFAEMEL
jgi:hypothetical protein